MKKEKKRNGRKISLDNPYSFTFLILGLIYSTISQVGNFISQSGKLLSSIKYFTWEQTRAVLGNDLSVNISFQRFKLFSSLKQIPKNSKIQLDWSISSRAADAARV